MPSTSAKRLIDLIVLRLTDRELRHLTWEHNGRVYTFREWMTDKYKGYHLSLSEEDLEREAERIVREYRGH